MAFNLDKLAELSKPRSAESIEREVWYRDNREWLLISQQIALAIFFILQKEHISQKELAERMGVSPTYVGKLLKGKENLTLETIVKVEKAIGHQLISTCKPYLNTTIMKVLPKVDPINQVSSNEYSAIKTYKGGYYETEIAVA